MIYEHPQFPPALKQEMYAWLREHAADEHKPSDTQEQFLYKSRKKALGPFKQRLWGISEQDRQAIARALEDRFSFLMGKLRIADTADLVRRFITTTGPVPERDAEILAAGGQITAAEKKAEGLAD